MYGALKLSKKASLVAVRHSIAAWAGLSNGGEGRGMATCDDGARKVCKLDPLLQDWMMSRAPATLLTNDLLQESLQKNEEGHVAGEHAWLSQQATHTPSNLQKGVPTELKSSTVWKAPVSSLYSNEEPDLPGISALSCGAHVVLRAMMRRVKKSGAGNGADECIKMSA